MSIIPKKSKTNGSDDTGIHLEALMVIGAISIIINTLLETKVHEKIAPFLFPSLACMGLFLLLPSKINKGKVGYIRLIIYIKFRINKIKEKVARKTYENK